MRKYRILPHEFTIAAGEMTPTLKVKRNVVNDAYREPHRRDVRGPSDRRPNPGGVLSGSEDRVSSCLAVVHLPRSLDLRSWWASGHRLTITA